MKVLRSVALTVLCLAFAAPAAWATTLTLDFVDQEGSPVQVAKAELLLVAWGNTERIELDTAAHGTRLRLELEANWLSSRWGRLRDQFGVHIYLQAPPLAAIRSERFLWPTEGDSGPSTIIFPNGQRIVVPSGADATMSLRFRQPTVRRVRIVAPDGQPIPGLAFEASMFWSQSNHCGVLAGAEPLGTHTTDAGGWLQLPDGDFEYALEFAARAKYDYMFPDYRGIPWRKVTHLQHPATEIVAYRYKERALEVRVRRGDQGVPGVTLLTQLIHCCGACSGPLGQSDATGRIEVQDFQPEIYSHVWLLEGDVERWRATVESLPAGIVEVQLPAPAAAAPTDAQQ